MSEQKEIINTLPLGLAAFALSLFSLSLYFAGVIPMEELGSILPLLFLYGGLGLVVTGIFELRNNNAFVSTAFFSYGAFWLFFAAQQFYIGTGQIELGASAAAATAWVLVAWGIFSFYMWFVTFKVNWAIWFLFLTLWIGLFMLAAANFGVAGLAIPGGWVLLICSLSGWYTSAALLINEAYGKTILPLGTG